MGHSEASLYRYTSKGWPLTKGSFGRLISRGTISVVEPLRDETRAAASAFARGLKGELVPRAGPAVVGEGRAEPALEPLSDAVDSDRGPRGTVRLARFWLDSAGDSEGSGRTMSSSGGG